MNKKILVGLGVAGGAAPLLAFAQSAGSFTVPTSTASQFLATVTAMIADPGLLTVVIVAVAIPLVFYVLHQLIGLIPKSRSRK